ncbi:membrane hypothetical protein [Cupriavidus taiwanensis]|nr:membrane hypothetical protein [Cupriavidus taiwanensis]SOZ32314.1 membrane hypothetical protein [Cupriavidus taiwanensis]SOZ47907.1 membrane hypothetical protein [Cupriavidus taiwanensis]
MLLATLAALYLADALHLAAIILCVFLMAVAGEFRYTATTALIPELVKEGDLASVNGIQQAFRGGVAILGPLLGAVGYRYFGLLSLLSVATFLAVYATYVTRALEGNACKAEGEIGVKSFFADYISGLAWLNGERQLKTVLMHFTLVFGFLSAFRTLTVPHVLDLKGEQLLAAVVSAQGAGMLFTGIMLARTRRQLNFESMVFLGCHVLGIAVALFGLSSHPLALVGTSFLIGACICVIGASNQGLWQSRTPKWLQGRMVAVRSITLYLLSPLAIYLSVPLADSVKKLTEDASIKFFTYGHLSWSGLLVVGLGIAISIVSAISHRSYKASGQVQTISQRIENAENGKDKTA